MARTSQDTRERILEAAEAALETQSSRVFQLRDIAAEVGVSASLIVQYFGGKEELVFEASLRRLVRSSADYAAQLAALPKSEWTVPNLVRASVLRDYTNPHVGRDLLSQSWWWSADHEVRLQDVLKARLGAATTVIHHVLNAPESADLTDEIRILSDIYYSGLRDSLVFNRTAEEAIADIARRIDLVMQGWLAIRTGAKS